MLGNTAKLGIVCGRQCLVTPLIQQERGMANLKIIAMRLKSVKNIQKITASMKMVSASKYAKAERELKAARPYGSGSRAFFEKAVVKVPEEEPKKELIVAITSDRGLCGAVHSNICKNIRNDLLTRSNIDNVGLICVGDKSRAILSRLFAKNILMVGSEIGRLPPQFGDASKVATMILNSQYEYDFGRLVYNRFKTVVSYQTTVIEIFSPDVVGKAEKITLYDSIDADVLQSYLEYSLASLIFYCMKEGACSEQSSRMTAMDSSTKNAGEMIEKLTLTYNRTRQSVITGELIEIISGAAAL